VDVPYVEDKHDEQPAGGHRAILQYGKQLCGKSAALTIFMQTSNESMALEFLDDMVASFKDISLRNGCISCFLDDDCCDGMVNLVSTFKTHVAVCCMDLETTETDENYSSYAVSVTAQVAEFTKGRRRCDLVELISSHYCDETEWEVLRNYSTQDKVLAFAMGMHARLGRSSAVRMISNDILAMIAKGMVWDPLSSEELLAFLRKRR
jgi:hypothetical protein